MTGSKPVGPFLVSLLAIALTGCTVATTTPGASVLTPEESISADIAQLVGTPTQPGSLSDFWRVAFPALAKAAGSDATYRDPAAVLPYLAGSLPRIECVAKDDPNRWVNNALYCDADERIGYDVGFLHAETNRLGPGGAVSVGRMGAVMILAHEWGHHVHNLVAPRPRFDLQAELQADCFAGIFAEHLSRVGALAQDEVNHALFEFFDLGTRTYGGGSWFDPQQHGSGLDRARAFGTGMASGDVSYCLPYETYTPAADVHLGPFSLGVAPGIPVEQDATGRLIAIGKKATAAFKFLAAADFLLPGAKAEDVKAGDILTNVVEPTVSGETDYKGVAFASIGPGIALMPGSSASVQYVRPTSNPTGFAHGYWVVQVLPTGALLINVEAPGLIEDGARDVLDFEYVLLWQLCIDGIDTYTCPSAVQ